MNKLFLFLGGAVVGAVAGYFAGKAVADKKHKEERDAVLESTEAYYQCKVDNLTRQNADLNRNYDLVRKVLGTTDVGKEMMAQGSSMVLPIPDDPEEDIPEETPEEHAAKIERERQAIIKAWEETQRQYEEEAKQAAEQSPPVESEGKEVRDIKPNLVERPNVPFYVNNRTPSAGEPELHYEEDELGTRVYDHSPPPAEQPWHPYFITPEQYANDNKAWEKSTLFWYEGDDIVADENNEMVDDPIALVGWEWPTALKDGSDYDGSVYVRNPRIACDYEVIRYPGKYEEIAGVGR